MDLSSIVCDELLVEAIRDGTDQHVSLALLKFPKEEINRPTSCEVFLLHLALWRNHLSILERLLQAGAKVDVQDGESGWTCLHQALYLGNLAAAQKLLVASASLDTLDLQSRTPLDLVAQELRMADTKNGDNRPSSSMGICRPESSKCMLYSWGSGANYQLGTGSTDFHEHPVRVDALGAGVQIHILAAAKYHSAAVDSAGRLYTWGWGRGGRLGHPDHNIHAGERALIHPWAVLGLGKRQVTAIAAGKHHMLVCTGSGEVFSWGSNKDGKLGYGGVDTQPTPKKVALLRTRCTTVAAANKHSAALTVSGEVYTWGANGHGQLGYGIPASDSGGNSTPRMVEALKGKALKVVSCAKRHTVVLSADGEPYTFGHKIVTPRRVILAGGRDTTRGAANYSSAASNITPQQLHFHKGHNDMHRPLAVSVSAGYSHTSVITTSGAVLCWASADPNLRVREVCGGLAGKRVTCISAGKLRSAAVTEQGDVYIWEALDRSKLEKNCVADQQSSQAIKSPSLGSVFINSPVMTAQHNTKASEMVHPKRVPGIKRVVAISVGEKHSLALVSVATPVLSVQQPALTSAPRLSGSERSPPKGSGQGSGIREGEDVCWEDEGEEVSTEVLSTTTLCHTSLELRSRWASASDLGLSAQLLKQHLASQLTEDLLHDEDEAVERELKLSVASLQMICQHKVCTDLVEPRSVLQLLEYADMAEAPLLKWYCIAYTLQNLDLVILESRSALESLSPNLVQELETYYKAWLSPQRPGIKNDMSLAKLMKQSGSGSRDGFEDLSHVISSISLGGGSPPLGSSPISYGSGSNTVSSSWIDRWRSTASPAAMPNKGPHTTSGLVSIIGGPKQKLMLLPGRRPTAAPSWMAGRTHSLMYTAATGALPSHNPHSSTCDLDHAAQAARGAIKHVSLGGPSASASVHNVSSHQETGDVLFAAEKDQEAMTRGEARTRLMRNVRKKLQQTEMLEARRCCGMVLDAQQLAKLGQRETLLEALADLESPSVPLEDVQNLLTQSQELAAKLAASGPLLLSTSVQGALTLGIRNGGGGLTSSTSRRRNTSSSIPRQLSIRDTTIPTTTEKAAGMSSVCNTVSLTEKEHRHHHQGSSLTVGLKHETPALNKQVSLEKTDSVFSEDVEASASAPLVHEKPLLVVSNSCMESGVSMQNVRSATPSSAWSVPKQTDTEKESTNGPLMSNTFTGGFDAFPTISGVCVAECVTDSTSSNFNPIAASVSVGAAPIHKQESGAGIAIKNRQAKGKQEKPAPRKGGLSLFLSGILDTPFEVSSSQSHAAPPASPAASQPRWPAWGGAATLQQTGQPAASIRELLSQTGEGKDEKRCSSKEHPAITTTPHVSAEEKAPLQVKGSSSSPHVPLTQLRNSRTLSSSTKHSSGSAIVVHPQEAIHGRVLLADFVSVPVKSAPTKSTATGPAWGMGSAASKVSAADSSTQPAKQAGTSYPPGQQQQQQQQQHMSLKHIQAEQEHYDILNRLAGSSVRGLNMTHNASSSSAMPISGTSPPTGASPVLSKWYVPDSQQQPRQALSAIQTEEVAVQKLQQLYGSKATVRVVQSRYQSGAPTPSLK
ncbi:hypothetical protein CEUSTIGMA_g3631.t1 [Chlamydomonas eustigma]|uniref:Uncharacterized protein n=1 Tax=Chlamydomonas eustigma TaxID=1157962 RepID=A0A250WZC0_9CHLO|nr:hypothetical protein CEUSTIGMA_g3631.t1 [Chlamydomonas eustigma]|eukprot:GAX76187.1 hypothetical protein CEUSTIGMA_g3631.t1 [Chlamydomonas eustigma]